MQLEWTGDTWQHQQRQLNRSNFFLSTDGSNSHSFLLHSTLCSANAFLSSSLIRTRHSLSRASHVHTNTFAGYHTATLTFLLSRHSLFSDLESKGSGQRLRKNQARPPQLLSKKKKNARLKKSSSLEEHQFSDQVQFTVLVFQIRSRFKGKRAASSSPPSGWRVPETLNCALNNSLVLLKYMFREYWIKKEMC